RAGIVRTRGVAPGSVANPSFHSLLPSSKARYRHSVVAPVYSAVRVALVIVGSSLPRFGRNKVAGAYQQRPALLLPLHLHRISVEDGWRKSSRTPGWAPAQGRS